MAWQGGARQGKARQGSLTGNTKGDTMKINKCTITIYPRYHWTPFGNVQEHLDYALPLCDIFKVTTIKETHEHLKRFEMRYVWNFCGLELSRKDVYHIPESLQFRSYNIKNDKLIIELRPKKRKVYKPVKCKN